MCSVVWIIINWPDGGRTGQIWVIVAGFKKPATIWPAYFSSGTPHRERKIGYLGVFLDP
jgi:hypothetical protein